MISRQSSCCSELMSSIVGLTMAQLLPTRFRSGWSNGKQSSLRCSGVNRLVEPRRRRSRRAKSGSGRPGSVPPRPRSYR